MSCLVEARFFFFCPLLLPNVILHEFLLKFITHLIFLFFILQLFFFCFFKFKHPILDKRISVLCPQKPLGYTSPWILKRTGLEISGRWLIFLISKTKIFSSSLNFWFFLNKKRIFLFFIIRLDLRHRGNKTISEILRENALQKHAAQHSSSYLVKMASVW